MPDKTERILGHLPRTFRPASRNSALRAVADAFGAELQQGENSLAAVMAAHWVDHADRGAVVIDDLACLAALYGLAPREGESVEEFREHLKAYVRTFLEGTVTVRGILRITAEALGLHISEDLETPKRSGVELTTIELEGEDAAELIFGEKTVGAAGRAALAAAVTGDVDLKSGIELPASAVLRLSVDGAAPTEITLGEEEAGKKNLDQIIETIKEKPGIDAFTPDGRQLALASKTTGPASRIEFLEGDSDAAAAVLGLLPRAYRGGTATSAEITGTVDLGGGADLSRERYLRLVIDSVHAAEIDCAGADPAHTTSEEICGAINGALGLQPAVARPVGQRLRLTSPTAGKSSSIALQKPAAQDATARLFGPVLSIYLGSDDRPAEFTGRRDLSPGLDLRSRSSIQLRMDGGPSVTINCAGLDPANTRPSEIAAAINAAFKSRVASQDGRFITITSPTPGPSSRITVETPPSGDVTEEVFGIRPRVYTGAAASRARIVAPASESYDFWARHQLMIAVDGADPVEIDLRTGDDPGAVPVDRLADRINQALGADVASAEDGRLVIVSPTAGGASSLAVLPLQCTRTRRFVTRAIITDEASRPVFGFIARRAAGSAGTSARLPGVADLSRGVDLREERYLRLSLDDLPAVDIDCAGARPRATLIGEVVNRINEAFDIKDAYGNRFLVASQDGHSLILTSPTVGSASRIAFEPPRSTDALQTLGLEPGAFAGQDAAGIDFVGTASLGAGIDLAAGAAIKLGIDGAAPLEIVLGGTSPGHKTLPDIVDAINARLGTEIASPSGPHIQLALPPVEARRRLLFAPPDGPDATKAVFGISPPRSYEGEDAAPAKVIGIKDLIDVNLEKARFLRLAVDDKLFVDVDCAALATDASQAKLEEITLAINDALGREVAFAEGKRLALVSKRAGASGEVILETSSSGDARSALFGTVEGVVVGTNPAKGTDPLPAVIVGEADLLVPVDLSSRSLLRLEVDGRRADVDVAGADPKKTSLSEIVAAINAVFPDLAAATEDYRLRLTSPTAGETSSLSLLPLRYLELVEYPPERREGPAKAVRHGDGWPAENDGASGVFLEADIRAPHGAVGPTLVNTALGWQVRLLVTLHPGQAARLWRDPAFGLRAEIRSEDGPNMHVDGDEILVGPLGEQALVPFSGTWHLTGGDDEPASLQLNNPLASRLVALRSKRAGADIAVEAKESDLSAVAPMPVADGRQVRLTGRLRASGAAFHLVDIHEAAIARVRAGPGVDLKAYADRVVAVTGPLHPGDLPLLIAQRIVRLFDVKLSSGGAEESYPGVSIGIDWAPDSLAWQINAGPQSSRLVTAEELDKATVLTLPQGRSIWRYLDCSGARFDQACFARPDQAGIDATRFPGLNCAECWCAERGIFNVSRFSNRPPERAAAVYAPSATPDPAVEVIFRWESHRPGSFVVNLPLDLPHRFGGRFNQARFGQSTPELYERAVTEPADDKRNLLKLINSLPSMLVRAEPVPLVPLGWTAATMPFREPQFLTGGKKDAPARLYLAEGGVSGFIMLEARENGAWGNEISVTARPAGPAMYDVAVIYKGACFENARQAALGLGKPSPAASCKKGIQKSTSQETTQGGGLPALTGEILRPGPVGVLQAKAAGIEAGVSRDGTESVCDINERSEKNGE